jgi:mono/diheme cytochrome c family protein
MLALALLARESHSQAQPAACPEAGEKLYERSCMLCHGKEAVGGSTAMVGERVDGPPLRGLASAPDADWEQLIGTIEQGHGAMPGWGGVINRPNIRRILEYLDSLDRPELYAHDMQERAKKRRGDKPSECELEAEATQPLPPVQDGHAPVEPSEPPPQPEPDQEG